MPRIELERIEEIDDVDQRSSETFDRIEFAQRMLAIVKPARTTVAICEGARRVRVEAGRQWGGAPGERWAILAVPRDASRKAITSAVLELAVPARPWTLDVLVGGEGGPAS